MGQARDLEAHEELLKVCRLLMGRAFVGERHRRSCPLYKRAKEAMAESEKAIERRKP